MKSTRLTLKVTPEYQESIRKRASKEKLSISDYIRLCIEKVHTNVHTNVHTEDTPNKDQNPAFLMEQISIKDEQIKNLQSALDQSQQLQAMTEKRYETEHQQLIEMKDRSFWQKLTSVFE